MKILMITSYLPYPLFGGGEVRTYNLLKRLSKKHEITLIAYKRSSNTDNDINEVKKVCKDIIVLNKDKTWTLKNILRTGFSTMPLLLTVYHSRKDIKAIQNIIRQNTFDLIHVEPFYIMHNIPQTRTPILLVEHNIEYLVYRRYVNHFPLLPLRPLLHLDVGKMKEWEKVMWTRADRVAVVSALDKKIIEETGVKNVAIIPNGVDLSYFKYSQESSTNPIPTVLYVGNMRWFENRDAVNYLLMQIWPNIKAQVPQARLLIVGREADKHFSSREDKSIKIYANVPDIRKFYQEATCLLAPIRKGGGTKYKILEAMASGLPVITTSIGVEGLEIENNREAKIAETPTDLANATCEILIDKEQSKSLAKNARELIENKYSWDSIAEKLNILYNGIVNEKN